MHPLDVATASAAAGVVARLVGTSTSHVTAQLVRGELPHAEGVDPGALEELLGVLVRPGYLDGNADDLTDAAGVLGRACGLHAQVGRRMLTRGLFVTTTDKRAFVPSGSDHLLLEDVGRASKPRRHDLALTVPWRPWEAIDAIAGVLHLDVPQWRHDRGAPLEERLWEVEVDAGTITSVGAGFYSDQAHAMVVQLGDLVARVAAMVAELDEQ